MLTATTESTSTSIIFDWQVIDACSETLFVTSPKPVSDMVFIYGSSPMSQMTQVKTKLEVDHSIPCSVTLSLTPTADYISLSGSNIVVDGTSMTQIDLGVKYFTLTATSPFSTQVTAANYDFSV